LGAGVGFGSLSLDDLALPEGDVIVLGIVANLSFTSEDANIAATWSGDFSIGTKATIDADLVDDDEANLLPSTAIGPAVADVIASARYAAVPVEAAQILELDAPEPLKINMLVDALEKSQKVKAARKVLEEHGLEDVLEESKQAKAEGIKAGAADAIAKAEELKGQKAPKAPKAKKVQEDKKGEDGAQ
jgi:hypothetical protein